MTTFVAINLRAGSGSAARTWPDLSRLLESGIGRHRHGFAAGPGDIAGQVKRALSSGATRIIAVGGDGTVNEAVNGLAAADGSIARGVSLGVIPVGTGRDLARGLGIPGDPAGAVARIARGRTRAIDLGRVSYLDDGGAPETRLFANIASFGISGLIDRKVSAAPAGRFLPGPVSYLLATVHGLLGYRFQAVRLTVDGAPPVERDIAVVAVANGRFFGGGMMIAPDARPDDGQFDVVVLRGTSKFVMLRDLRLVYGGRHRDHPSIAILRGRRIRAEPCGPADAPPVLIDVDGESPGRLPATVEVVPRAVEIFC